MPSNSKPVTKPLPKPFAEMTKEEKKAWHNGTQNLIPMNLRTPEERRAIQSKGGKASRAALARRNKIRDDMMILLRSDVADDDMRKWLVDHDLDTSNQMLMCLKAVLKAQTGDIDAAKFVRDTVGEKPVAGIMVSSVSPEDLDGVDMRTLSDEELLSLAQAEDDE